MTYGGRSLASMATGVVDTPRSLTGILTACCAWLMLARFGISCRDRKSTRLNSSHGYISYAVFCLKKKKKKKKLTLVNNTQSDDDAGCDMSVGKGGGVQSR